METAVDLSHAVAVIESCNYPTSRLVVSLENRKCKSIGHRLIGLQHVKPVKPVHIDPAYDSENRIRCAPIPSQSAPQLTRV